MYTYYTIFDLHYAVLNLPDRKKVKLKKSTIK